ncbi:MAG: hypothetical protein ACNA7U_03840 [Candidatus Izemoplasmataceae bacterium]
MPQTKGQKTVINNNMNTRNLRPALTPEAEENQMMSLAIELAKKQLSDGTASSQVITHFLQLASSKKKLESEIMELQKDLLVAKTESLRQGKKIEELYNNAIQAMRVYSGNDYDRNEEYGED